MNTFEIFNNEPELVEPPDDPDTSDDIRFVDLMSQLETLRNKLSNNDP